MKKKVIAGLAAFFLCAVPMTALACGPCGGRNWSCPVSGCQLEDAHEHCGCCRDTGHTACEFCGYCSGVGHTACEFCGSTEHCSGLHDCTGTAYTHHREHGHGHRGHHS